MYTGRLEVMGTRNDQNESVFSSRINVKDVKINSSSVIFSGVIFSMMVGNFVVNVKVRDKCGCSRHCSLVNSIPNRHLRK